jgi:chorismate-pyruvate lyase
LINPKTADAAEFSLVLNNYGINISDLSAFQKILLIADGTLTNILEAYLAERICVNKIAEEVTLSQKTITDLGVDPGEELLQRKILLYGDASSKNWIYAHSIIALNRLQQEFREQLVNSKIPIGKLWRKYKVETFKEIVDYSLEPANDFAQYFSIERDEQLLSRTYRVISDRKQVMLITEKFPTSFFL